MDNTKRAVKAKERALIKIENNINSIYSDPSVLGEIDLIQKNLKINKGEFFEKYKEEAEKYRSIQKLTNFLMEKWIEQTFKDKNVIEIINEHHAIYNINNELDHIKNKIDVANTKKISFKMKEESERYLKMVIKELIEGRNFIFFWNIKINQQIWRSIIGAMLFDVPKKTTIKLKESVLRDYMPTINDHLQIQINELTKLGDLECIKSEIKRKQRKFENRYKNKNIKRVSKTTD